MKTQITPEAHAMAVRVVKSMTGRTPVSAPIVINAEEEILLILHRAAATSDLPVEEFMLTAALEQASRLQATVAMKLAAAGAST